jgi:hypothetical protein
MSNLRLMNRTAAVALACGGLFACASKDDQGTDVDGGPGDADPCGFGDDSYLPYVAGYRWTYRITDKATGGRTTKSQWLESVNDPDFGAVLKQTTEKVGGLTVSLTNLANEQVVRFVQEDYDTTTNPDGVLERTTTYTPFQLRLDMNADKVAANATFEETYTLTIEVPGAPPTEESRTDVWTVLGVDVECRAPIGTFRCLHVRRQRLAANADKEFFFAPGVGKVIERGTVQTEELTSCAAE